MPTSRRRCRSSSASSALRSRSSSRSAPIIGAMITMYASVASRTGEIGTLRALGFSRARRSWSRSSSRRCARASSAALVGLAGASFMQAITISTMNFQTFSELAFSFTLTPSIVASLARVRAGHGVRRRLPAGGARGAAEDRRRVARRMSQARPLARACARTPWRDRCGRPPTSPRPLPRMRFVQLDPDPRAGACRRPHPAPARRRLPRGRSRPRFPALGLAEDYLHVYGVMPATTPRRSCIRAARRFGFGSSASIRASPRAFSRTSRTTARRTRATSTR